MVQNYGRQNRNPRGYLKDWKNFEEELNSIISTEYRDGEGDLIKDAGEFPKQNQLARIKRNDIAVAAGRHHGGLTSIRKKMGYESSTKPPNYWLDWNNFETEMKKEIGREYRDEKGFLIKAIGEFPTFPQLVNAGKYDLINAAKRHHENLETICRRMGYEKPRAKHYLDYFENLEREIDGIISSIERFPYSDDLRGMGRNDLEFAIIKKYGGFDEVRKRMGYEGSRESSKKWNLERIGEEYRQISESLGHPASTKELVDLKRRDLLEAIHLYTDGIASLRQKLSMVVKSPEYYEDFGNLRAELEPIISEIGDFPTYTQLVERQRYDITHAISDQHGGFGAVREKMGYKKLQQNSKKKRYSLETKMNVVGDYLFNEKRLVDVCEQYETDEGNLYRWYQDTRVLSEIAQRRGLTLEQVIVIRDRKLGKSKLTPDTFPSEVEHKELLKRAVELYGEQSSDLADILAFIIYPGVIDRDDAYRLVTHPSLSRYLGNFLKPGRIPSLDDARPLVEEGKFDKNQAIHDLFFRTGRHYYVSLLGSTPSENDKQDVLEILQSDMEKEENTSMKLLLEELVGDFQELYTIGSYGLAERIRRPDVSGW